MKKLSLIIVSLILVCLLSTQSFAYPEKAFEIVQRSKARLFIDRVISGPVDYRQKADEKLVNRERELMEKIKKTRREVLFPENSGIPDFSSFPGEKLGRLYREYEDLLMKIKISNPYPPARVEKTPGLSKIKKEIPKDALLLEYYTGKENSYLFILDNRRLDMVELEINPQKLKKMIQAYIAEIDKNSDIAVIKARGKDLANKLKLDLIDRKHPGKTLLIIAPHSFLHWIPFHTLTLPDGNAIIEKYRVLLTPSATAYYHLKYRSAHKTMNGKSVLFSLDTESVEKDPLYQPPSHFLKNQYPFDDVFTGREFTRNEFLRIIPAKSLIHVTDPYSFINRKFFGFSQFFSFTEPIYLYDVNRTRVKPELLILDFPGSGTGFRTRGDDVMSFARGFLSSGADTVLADVSSEKHRFSEKFWLEFYRVLQKDKSPTLAYQKAVIEAMKHEPAGFWARYVLVGIE